MADKIQHPKVCDLCGKDLTKEEKYYIGITRYNILAYTCLDYECKKWLIHRKLMQQGPEEKEGQWISRSGGEIY